jgi:hypothetical protein
MKRIPHPIKGKLYSSRRGVGQVQVQVNVDDPGVNQNVVGQQ